MARIPVVSRTLKSTLCECLCVLPDNSTCNKTFRLAREWKNTPKLLKVLQEKYNTEDCKIVHVLSLVVEYKMYAMTEERFAELATPVEKPEIAVAAE